MKQNTLNIILIVLVIAFAVILGGLVLIMRGKSASTTSETTEISEPQTMRSRNTEPIGKQEKEAITYDEVIDVTADFASLEKKVDPEANIGIRNTSGKKLFIIQNTIPVALADQEVFPVPPGKVGATLYRVEGLGKETFISIIR